MVIGDSMREYFRKDHCIYLTKTMFKYLRVVHEDLLAQAASGSVNPYMLASLHSIIRLQKINLRCLAICKIDLNEIVSKEECEGFEQLQSKLDANALIQSVEARAAEAKTEAEVRAKAKEAKEKELEEKTKAEEALEEAKKAKEAEEAKKKEQEPKPVMIKTDGSAIEAVKTEEGTDEKEKKKEAAADGEKKKEDEEKEAETEPEEPSVEQVEQIWKNAAQIVLFVKNQSLKLDDTLV